jgi:serine/threonine protein kinase
MMFTKREKAGGYLSRKTSFPGNGDCSEDKHADIQGNTFAFGVILLEIISGRLPYCKDKGYLVDWVRQSVFLFSLDIIKNYVKYCNWKCLTQAAKYLQQAEEIGKLVDPEVTNVRTEDLAVVCSVVSRCIDPDPSKRPSMQIITGVLENGIDLSAAAMLKESSLAWAELALAV